jgi:hypothetical protein
MRVLLPALLFGACDPAHTNEPAVDARVVVDTVAVQDAPFMCTPIAPRVAPGAACLALMPGSLQGDTPFGRLDVGLDYFGAGDCITISNATIGWTGSCGEQLRLTFGYPVTSDPDGTHRRVTQSFDADARFELTPPGMAMRVHTTMIHVAVTHWQEGTGTHDIDITVNVTDSKYAVAPWRVHGTFCDWPYYLC